MTASEDALAAAVTAHIASDPWPGVNTLAFMQPRIEDAPRRLTIACQCATGGPRLCGGRVALVLEELDGTPLLWPAGPCSSGHQLADVERAFAAQADAMGRGAPGSDDPVRDYERAVASEAIKVGIPPGVVRRILAKAGGHVSS